MRVKPYRISSGLGIRDAEYLGALHYDFPNQQNRLDPDFLPDSREGNETKPSQLGAALVDEDPKSGFSAPLLLSVTARHNCLL